MTAEKKSSRPVKDARMGARGFPDAARRRRGRTKKSLRMLKPWRRVAIQINFDLFVYRVSWDSSKEGIDFRLAHGAGNNRVTWQIRKVGRIFHVDQGAEVVGAPKNISGLAAVFANFPWEILKL